jgi:transposase
MRGRSWRRVSAVGALAYRLDGSEARVFLCMHEDTIRTAQVLGFLSHLHRHLDGPVLVIWDGLNAHRSPSVQRRLAEYGWTAERLPAYAPELNPVEGLWSWTKGTTLANRGREELLKLMDAVRRATRRIRRLPSVRTGLLAKAGLSL